MGSDNMIFNIQTESIEFQRQVVEAIKLLERTKLLLRGGIPGKSTLSHSLMNDIEAYLNTPLLGKSPSIERINKVTRKI